MEITAIVVTFNEEKHLAKCLNSLTFCDQLIVADLSSSDNCQSIAREYTPEVYEYPHVEVVEEIRPLLLPMAKHNWVCFIDPDEYIVGEITHAISTAISDSHIGIIAAPWQNYFRGKPLTTTIWGRRGLTKKFLIHRDRVDLVPNVHRGFVLRADFTEHNLEREPANMIHHIWVDSFHELHEKHERYLKKEGFARYKLGYRFSWHQAFRQTIRSLKKNLCDYRGFIGGPDGIFLSFFHAWYVFRCWIALRNFQQLFDSHHPLNRN